MNYVNIGLDNGLSPEQRQASILYHTEFYADSFSIGFQGTNFRSFSKYLNFPWRSAYENVVCCEMWAILPHSQWRKVSVRVFSSETRHVRLRCIYQTERSCHYDDSTAPRVATMTWCHKWPHSRHIGSPRPQCTIHRSNINHNKAIHIWYMTWTCRPSSRSD